MFEVKEFLRNIFVMRKSCMYLRKFSPQRNKFLWLLKGRTRSLGLSIFLVYKINAKFSGFVPYNIFITFSMGQVLLFNM